MVPIWNTKLYVWLNYTDQFQGFFHIFAAIILLLFYLFIYFLAFFSPVLATCIMQRLLCLFLALNMSQMAVTWSGFVAVCVMLVKEAMPGFCAPLG